MVVKLLCFLAAVIGARSASAPFIKPCKIADNECVLASAQAALPIVAPGIPDLGIKSLDPMRLDLVKVDQSGLHLSLKDTDVTGMKGCITEGFKHDMAKQRQVLTIRCTVHLTGDYTLDGQLFVLPVKGNGKHDIDIHDIIIKAIADLEAVKGEDGKDHWHIKSWKHSYVTKTGAHFDFQNLFDGNEILAKPVSDLLNNSWADVMKEIAPPIVYAIVERVVDGVEALYKAVPLEALVVA